MTDLDVTLSGHALNGKSLPTVGTRHSGDTSRWLLGGVLSLLVSLNLGVFVEESLPLSLASGARELVLTELAAQDDLLRVVLRTRVVLREVAPDGSETQLVGEPEPRPAQGLVRWLRTELAHHVALGRHLLPSLLTVVGQVGDLHLLVVDLAVVLHQLLAEQSLTFRVVAPGLTLSAGQQEVVAGLHVVLQVSHLGKVLLACRALQDHG